MVLTIHDPEERESERLSALTGHPGSHHESENMGDSEE